MASSSACFMPCDRRPAGEAIRSMRPVSRRISTLATGSERTGAEPIPLGVSAVVRASLRHSATVRLSKTLATWNLRPTPSATTRSGVRPVIGLARDLDPALERLGAVAEAADQSRLARAVRADDADELAGTDLKVDVLKHREAAERAREAGNLQKRRCARRRRAARGAATATRGTRVWAEKPKTAAEARRARPASPSGRRMMMTTNAAPSTSCHRNGKSPERLALR